MGDLSITLDSRYTATSGRVFLSGIQALVRLPMLQRMRDEAAGLNTAGFRLRLPRQPARRTRSGAVESKSTPRRQAHRLPAGGQRGPRGDGRLGYPATQSFSWRQDTMASSPCGTARGPVWTAAATCSARQRRRFGQAWWRSGDRRRRPRGQIVDPATPDRTHLQGGDDAGPLSGQRPGVSRLWPARLGNEPLLRLLGGDEGAGRYG
jgi:hypothetical protein